MAATGAIKVRGLRELNQAFSKADKDTRKFVRAAERDVAEPVKKTAEQLAVTNISHIGTKWSQMRIGVTQRFIYIAPKQRGTTFGPNKRSNLAGLLMGKAMRPALDQNRKLIEAQFEQAIDKIADNFSR